MCKYAKAQICPMVSITGGILAQEIVKYCGKFTPNKQWMHLDWFSSLPENVSDNDRVPQNDRYDDFIAIFGKDIATKVRASKWFLVGCGALGCEYIKMLSMLGFCCSKEGKLFTTDDDQIELSNLNR